MGKHSYGVPVVRGEHLLDSGRISTNWDDYWFVTEECASQYPKTRLEANDVVMSVRGTVGQFARVGKEHTGAQISPNTIRLSPEPSKVHPVFLYYAMKSHSVTAYLRGSVSSSAVPALRATDIKLAPLLLPSLPEQQAIAAILSALDDKIELNRQMNQTLEAMAQAIFKNWFVDFKPFRDQGMQDSPLGEIPKGWACHTVSEAINVNPTRRLVRGSDASYVDMASLPTGSARVLNVVTRPFPGSGSRFTNGDTLFARITPCLENGKTGLVDFLHQGESGWGSTEFIVLGPKPPLGSTFIYCLARDQSFRSHAIQSMTGTSGRQRVQSDCFDHYWLAVPPQSDATLFAARTAPLLARMKANDEEAKALAAIRDTLLPKLLSGEIRVKDAEKHMEKAI